MVNERKERRKIEIERKDDEATKRRKWRKGRKEGDG